jgi:hypothetical protein
MNLDVKPRDFACSCGRRAGKDNKNVDRCEAIMKWALDHLSTDRNGEIIHGKVTKENLLTSVVYELQWAYGASITGIDCDQWCAISTSTHDATHNKETDGYDPVDPPKFTTYIQCDDVEDGLAYTLKAYYDEFGNSRKRSDGEDDDAES